MKCICLFIISVLWITNTFGQDPFFINNHQSLTYLSPSFAGSNGGVRYQSAYRNKWPGLQETYVTYFNSFDAYVKRLKGGVALSWLHDDQAGGTLVTNSFNLIYARHINLSDGKLKIIPSLQFTCFEKTLDNSKVIYANQIYPNKSGFLPQWPNYTNVRYSKKSNLDFSSGLIINYKHLYIGVSVFHITQPDEGLYGVSKLPARLNLYSSYNFLINEKTLITFFSRYENQHFFNSFQLGINTLFFKHLILGTSCKSGDNLSFNIGYRHQYFTMQVNFDETVNVHADNTAGSWEILASFNIRNKENRKVITDFERW